MYQDLIPAFILNSLYALYADGKIESIIMAYHGSREVSITLKKTLYQYEAGSLIYICLTTGPWNGLDLCFAAPDTDHSFILKFNPSSSWERLLI
jgi:hypothetical protein